MHSCLSAPQLSLSSPDITELLTAHVFHHHFSNDYHYHTAVKFSVTASYLADFFPIFKERDHRRRGKNEGLGGTEGCRVEEEGEEPGWKTTFKLEQHMLLWSYVTWPYYYHVNTNQIYYHLIVGSQQTNASPSLFIRAFTASCYFDSSPSTSLLPVWALKLFEDITHHVCHMTSRHKLFVRAGNECVVWADRPLGEAGMVAPEQWRLSSGTTAWNVSARLQTLFS